MLDSTQHPEHQRKEKSLHLFWEFPPFIQGGLGIAGKGLCDALSNHTQIEIACPEFSTSSNHKHPYPVYQVKMPTNAHLNTTYPGKTHDLDHPLTESINAFSKGVVAAHFTGYKAIHAHDWITTQAAKNIQDANLPNHIPIILHIHSTQIDRVGEQTNGAIFTQEKQAMHNADAIITVSEITKNSIINHYNIHKDKITVISNSIQHQTTPPLRPTHPPTILYVARMEPQKSPLFAIEIICAALKKTPGARAIIAGKGSSLNILRDLVKFKKMDSSIEVLGHIPHEKMHLVYQISDVLILPSAAEPFGLVALEAAQAGIAVILSDRCGASETLTSAPTLPLNTTSSLHNWVDTTVSLLTDEQKRAQQVHTQLTQLNLHNWDIAAKKLLSTLNT